MAFPPLVPLACLGLAFSLLDPLAKSLVAIALAEGWGCFDVDWPLVSDMMMDSGKRGRSTEASALLFAIIVGRRNPLRACTL